MAEGSAPDLAGIRGGGQVIEIGGIEFPIGGDVLVTIDEHSISSMIDLLLYLESETRVGDIVRLGVLRDDESITFLVAVGERR